MKYRNRIHFVKCVVFSVLKYDQYTIHRNSEVFENIYCMSTGFKMEVWDKLTVKSIRFFKLIKSIQAYGTRLVLTCFKLRPFSGNNSNSNIIRHLLKLFFNASTIDELGEWCLKKVQPQGKQSQMHRVSMTTMWAATTRHSHAENQWKLEYFPYSYHTQERWWGWGKISENFQVAKNKCRMTWHLKPSCKQMSEPLHATPDHPTYNPWGTTAGQHCFVFNLA